MDKDTPIDFSLKGPGWLRGKPFLFGFHFSTVHGNNTPLSSVTVLSSNCYYLKIKPIWVDGFAASDGVMREVLFEVAD